MAIKKYRYALPAGGAADAFAMWSIALSSGEIHQSLDLFTASIAGKPVQQINERDVIRPASPAHNVSNPAIGTARTLYLGTGNGTTAILVLTMLNNGSQAATGQLEVLSGTRGDFVHALDDAIALQPGESETYHLLFIID